MALNKEKISSITQDIKGMSFSSGFIPEKEGVTRKRRKVKVLLVKGHPEWDYITGIPERHHLRIITGIHAMRTLVGEGRELDYFNAHRVWKTTNMVNTEAGIEILDEEEGIWSPSLTFLDHSGNITARCHGPLEIITAIRYSQDALADFLSAKDQVMISSSLGLTPSR